MAERRSLAVLAMVVALVGTGCSKDTSDADGAKALSEATTRLADAKSFTELQIRDGKAIVTSSFQSPNNLKHIFEGPNNVPITAIVIGDKAWSQLYAIHRGEYVEATTESGKQLVADVLKPIRALQSATDVKIVDGHAAFSVAESARESTGYVSGTALVSNGSISEVKVKDAAGTESTFAFSNIGRITDVVQPPESFSVRGIEPQKRCSVTGSPSDKKPC